MLDEYVVPYVGTWIEISIGMKPLFGYRCRSLRGNVDRNNLYTSETISKTCRSLRGNVDRNL